MTSQGDTAIISLQGDQDIANVAELSRGLAQAISAPGSRVVIDMSGVTFVSACTLGAIVAGRKLLRAQSRDLVLRSPRASAVRLLGLCGLTGLIEAASAAAPAKPASALATWVAVPRPAAARRPAMIEP